MHTAVDIWIGNDYKGSHILPAYIDEKQLWVGLENDNVNVRKSDGNLQLEVQLVKRVYYCSPWRPINNPQ